MSAAQNFELAQQMSAVQSMGALQAGQTTDTPTYQRQTNVQTPKATAHEMYMQSLMEGESQQKMLAESMRQQAIDAAKKAAGSGLQSVNASTELKNLNAGGRIQAKHPLDLLAIGIRGWKANKKQKEVNATAFQAKQDALVAANSTREAEKAEEREQFLWEKQHSTKPPEQLEDNEARSIRAYDAERALHDQNKVPEADRTYSTLAIGGRYAVARRGKESRLAGGLELEAGVDKSLQTDILGSEAGLQQLTRVEDGFKSEYFGVKGAAGGLMGKVADIAGFSDSDMSKFNAERSEYLSSLYQFSNKLIKERSGAAVTAQEWERFKKEFPVGFMGAQEFKVRLAGYIEDMAADNLVKMRQGGWEMKNGMLVEKEGAAPLMDKPPPDTAEQEAQGEAPPTFISPMGEELTNIQQNEAGDMIGYSKKLNDWVEVRQ